MGVARTYLSAVAAGALTAGLAAANVVAVPPDTAVSPQPTVRDVDLAAVITIPIVDIDTPGPISIRRLLTLTLEERLSPQPVTPPERSSVSTSKSSQRIQRTIPASST